MKKLIVALDVNSFKKAKKLVNTLTPYVDIFKIGSELFTSCGPAVISYINGKKRKVFLDLKFHDIPNTVASSARAAARHGVFMFNIHASGGYDMMRMAQAAVKDETKRLKIKKPVVLGVTVLTSEKKKDTAKEVVRLAKLSKKACLDGVVCSAGETKRVKKACGRKFIVVNPGVRPERAAKNDQKRITTPREAVRNGADFIVVGRPITQARSPVSAAKRISEEMAA
ncbi:MAG: orotidine-5'-phosphate decarboxylase [Candidatus Omnitrophica bacterium]|nr:orotidine-5'-phosphate decarboxylase [Candidatus Omnitrophota bacterium]